jgi:hypothetical protein
MAGLRAVIIVTVLMALILAAVGNNNRRLRARHVGAGYGYHLQKPCTTDPQMYQYFRPCAGDISVSQKLTTSTTSSTQSNTEESVEASSDASSEDSSDDSSEDSSEEQTTSTSTTSTSTAVPRASLEHAHWCRFSNGSFVPLGYSFIHKACSLCECTQSRALRCQLLQCMPTYCVDNTMPHRKPGQCCTQCGYEVTANSCLYKGINFPHGAVIKAVEDKMQCWCQLGSIECRNYMNSLFHGLDIFADGAAIYIIAGSLCVVLIFGLLLCCGCTVFSYYYYKRNQHTFQQAYDQYINPAGWQPIDESEENVVDTGAEEKRMEAEKYQFLDSVHESIPPPYGHYNGSYVPEQEQKKL